MNKRSRTLWILLALAALVPAGGVFMASSMLENTAAPDGENEGTTPVAAASHQMAAATPANVTFKVNEQSVRVPPPHPVYEEDGLEAPMRELYDQIEETLEGDDRAWLVALAAKVHGLIERKGYGAVPSPVRAKLVEALGLATPYTLSELMDYLRDPDPEVAASANNAFTDALQDTTNSDLDMAAIIKSIAKGDFGDEVTDAAIDYIESNMRNSVAVDSYIDILENGTDAMKRKAKDSIVDFVTARDENSIALDENLDYDSADVAHLTTVEGLKEWAGNHPDDDDDADFYRGVQ